jgi:hypothetical protein
VIVWDGTGRVLPVGVGPRCSDRLGCGVVGRAVGSTTGSLVVVCVVAGSEVRAVVVGALGVTVTDVLGVSAITGPACEFGGSPSNTPTAERAHTFTKQNTTTALKPAATARTDGAPYRPIGPTTGLPLPLTQNFQPFGAGGQSGSGLQVLGGSQLRRGGVGQLGGTTNRFT